MDLSIIIVNWNTHNLLRQCLKSIFKETKNLNFEVFVIDNASCDKSAEMVRPEFPQVKLIANKKNLGFAAANNQAINRASGKYILLLNPDIIILDHAIEKCINFLKNKISNVYHDRDKHGIIINIKIGVLGCKLLNLDKTWQASCRTFPKLFSQIIILLKLHHVFKNLKSIRKYLMADMDPNKDQEVNQVMGAFFLTSREVVKKIGTLDEKFWIWFEEVDFCKRAKKAGFATYYWPGAQIIHYKGISFNQVFSVKKQFYYNGALLRYFWKHGTSLEFCFLLLMWPISILLALLIQFIIKLKTQNAKLKVTA